MKEIYYCVYKSTIFQLFDKLHFFSSYSLESKLRELNFFFEKIASSHFNNFLRLLFSTLIVPRLFSFFCGLTKLLDLPGFARALVKLTVFCNSSCLIAVFICLRSSKR